MSDAAGVDADSADDAALLADARQADGGAAVGAAAPVAEVPAGPVVVDESAQWIEAAHMLGGVVRELLPAKCAAKLDAARLDRIGAALAKVAAHYGWKFAGMLTHPVAQLAFECYPVAEPVVTPWLKTVLAPKPAANDEPKPAAADEQKPPAA